MSEAPIQLIVAAFNEENAADEALKTLRAAKREKLIGIQSAAVVRRDARNKLHIREVGELSPGRGAVGGAVLGAVLGLLTGGIGLVLGAAGALLGGVIGKVHDVGFDNRRLEQIGASLKPGTSAILAVIEHRWVTQLQEELDEMGADVMTAAISADIAEQLEAKRDVVYSALADEGVLETARVAAGEDQVEVSTTTYTEEGVEQTDAIVTEEGIAGQRIVTTDEGVVVEAGAITEDGEAYGTAVITEAGAVMAGVFAPADELEAGDEDEAEAAGSTPDEEQATDSE